MLRRNVLTIFRRSYCRHGLRSTKADLRRPRGLDGECAIVINPCFVLNEDRRLRKSMPAALGRACRRSRRPSRAKERRYNRARRWPFCRQQDDVVALLWLRRLTARLCLMRWGRKRRAQWPDELRGPLWSPYLSATAAATKIFRPAPPALVPWVLHHSRYTSGSMGTRMTTCP
jgi:hypothetical protein